SRAHSIDVAEPTPQKRADRRQQELAQRDLHPLAPRPQVYGTGGGLSFLPSSCHTNRYPAPIRAGIIPSVHTPLSQSATTPKKIIRPTPIIKSKTPRRMSERWRCVGGGFNRAAGTSWPFSTIKRTVRCKARVLEKPKYMMTATINTGAPNTASIVTTTIGITWDGMSLSSMASLSLSMRMCPPVLNFLSNRRRIWSPRSPEGGVVALGATETAGADCAGLTAGETAGTWAKAQTAIANEKVQPINRIF